MTIYTINCVKPGNNTKTTVEMIYDTVEGRYVIVRWYN